MLNELKFYKDYFSIPFQDTTEIKALRLKQIIKEDIIYKYILFDDNVKLNCTKIKCLLEDKLWFSPYIYLNDPTEFEIKYGIKKVSNNVNRSKEDIHFMINSIKELYDICSFTYCNDKNMWNNYSNSGNGICLIFKVNEYDMLFPVDYIEKWKIDYNKIIINAINKNEIKDMWNKMEPLAILPFVTKNPQNGVLCSEGEKEVRILFPTFDDGLINNGRVFPNVKNKIRYKGRKIDYSYCGLELLKIEIGKRCSYDIQKAIISTAREKRIECVSY